MINILNLKLVIIFAKWYTPNWSEEIFVIKETKTTAHGFMLLVVSMVKKLLEHFMKNNYKKQIEKDLGLEKVVPRKVDKLYVKWKGYDNSINS